MTPDDARTLAAIMATADGGCGECVLALVKLCAANWPDIDWLALVNDTDEWRDDPIVPTVQPT